MALRLRASAAPGQLALLAAVAIWGASYLVKPPSALSLAPGESENALGGAGELQADPA